MYGILVFRCFQQVCLDYLALAREYWTFESERQSSMWNDEALWVAEVNDAHRSLKLAEDVQKTLAGVLKLQLLYS